MARPGPHPESYANIPSIIIDPSLYVPVPDRALAPERRWLLQRVCEGFIASTRFMVLVVLPVTIVFGVVKVQYGKSQHVTTAIEQLLSSPRRVAASRKPAPVESMGVEDPSPEAWLSSDAEGAKPPPECADQPEGLPSASSDQAALLPSASSDQAEPSSPEPLGGTVEATSTTNQPSKPRASVDLTTRVRSARRLLAQGRLDEAEQAYRKVLVLDEPAEALMGLARVQLARGELSDALSLAQRAVARDADHVGCRLILADVLRAQGARELSDAQYARATALSSQQQAPGQATATRMGTSL